jgi:hypothetical protein
VKLQLHKNDWFVTHARKELQWRADLREIDFLQIVGKLGDIIGSQSDVTRRLRGLWAAHAIGGTHVHALNRLTEDEHESIRAWAVRLITDLESVSPESLKKFATLARKDESALVRLHLASALQKLPFNDRWEIAEGLAGRAEDADDPMIPLMIWYGVEPLVKHSRGRALTLASRSKIPLVRQYIARRMAEPD